MESFLSAHYLVTALRVVLFLGVACVLGLALVVFGNGPAYRLDIYSQLISLLALFSTLSLTLLLMGQVLAWLGRITEAGLGARLGRAGVFLAGPLLGALVLGGAFSLGAALTDSPLPNGAFWSLVLLSASVWILLVVGWLLEWAFIRRIDRHLSALRHRWAEVAALCWFASLAPMGLAYLLWRETLWGRPLAPSLDSVVDEVDLFSITQPTLLPSDLLGWAEPALGLALLHLIAAGLAVALGRWLWRVGVTGIKTVLAFALVTLVFSLAQGAALSAYGLTETMPSLAIGALVLANAATLSLAAWGLPRAYHRALRHRSRYFSPEVQAQVF